MANDVKSDGTAVPADRDEYVISRTHEGPMGSLSEGSRIFVDRDDPRIEGMVNAGLMERANDGGEATSRRTSSRKTGDSGDRAAEKG